MLIIEYARILKLFSDRKKNGGCTVQASREGYKLLRAKQLFEADGGWSGDREGLHGFWAAQRSPVLRPPTPIVRCIGSTTC